MRYGLIDKKNILSVFNPRLIYFVGEFWALKNIFRIKEGEALGIMGERMWENYAAQDIKWRFFTR